MSDRSVAILVGNPLVIRDEEPWTKDKEQRKKIMAFNATLEATNGIAKINLKGELDAVRHPFQE